MLWPCTHQICTSMVKGRVTAACIWISFHRVSAGLATYFLSALQHLIERILLEKKDVENPDS